MSFSITIFIIILFFLSVPLFITIGLSAILQFFKSGIDPTVVIVELNRIASAPTLLAIPLFTFTGYILAQSKAPKRLFNLADSLIGWIPGGLSIVSLIVCAVFTCITGASGITIIAIGGLLYPILKNKNYPENFSLGLITSSGSLGLLFPPSLPLIIYGIIARVSIDQLFVAGIIPGIILMILLSIYSLHFGLKGKKTKTPFSLKNLAFSLKEAAWELPIPIIIIGGIYGGFLTIVEASATSAFYTLIVEFFVKKDLNIKDDLLSVCRDTVQLVGGIFVILGSSMGLTSFMIDAQIPQNLLNIIRSFITSKFTFLILLNIFLLIVGALLDIFSAIIIVVPLIVPIALSYGINPIHLGIIFLTNLEIGYITPPVGLNLFISSFRFKKSIMYLYKVSIPFLIVMLIGLILITYIPDLSLILVKLFYKI
ncbi:MAG: TRAP transporter large permease subunit [Candidatus Marinimicrobia bacterium]|nr:TRAP transporter large permease subunit [Candidatus Neomarinimicrobiota bacterium]